LRAALGDFDRPQDEDCLTLTIATPNAQGGPGVVFCMAALLDRAGSLDWYDAGCWRLRTAWSSSA